MANDENHAPAPRVVWQPAEVPPVAAELTAAGFPEHLAVLLARRGVDSGDAADIFLEPHLDHLHSPRQMHGIDAAVKRLLRARVAKETVAVVGDYDVDGVSGTALLVAVLGACGVGVEPILPHRIHDGYGFQPVHAERARELGCGVIVTVDCGTTSYAAIEAAREAGLDVIVTDHHLPGKALPDDVVLINPKQDACRYPFDELSGAGLALKLCLAFADAAGREIDPRQLLRIACLGTIADLVPLVGENRVIAALGLESLGESRSPGLRALMRAARVKPPLVADDIGFRLGPRLNAPGRLGSADNSLELLLARDESRAEQLAQRLDGMNRKRQDEERRVANEARTKFVSLELLPPILITWSEDWHRGVVGIAAGRLAREFHRPTILLAVEDGLATGSGRSIPGVHLHAFLDRYRDDLERFGGHAQAVGLTVATTALADLSTRWQEDAAEHFGDALGSRHRDYELELEPGEITPDFYADLARLEPHGQANPRPLIRLRGPLRLTRPPRFFGRDHVAAEVEGENGGRIAIVGWRWKERADLFNEAFELLGNLEIDPYRGGLRLRLSDGRPFSADENRTA